MADPKQKKGKVATASDELAKIRAKLGHLTMEWQPSKMLDTGVPDLNEVLGNRETGLTFGRIMEISGWESQGKTAIALCLAALAQKQGAWIIWIDFENSFDPTWAVARGLDLDKVIVIAPYVGSFNTKKKKKGEEEEEIQVASKKMRLATAQELCEEGEAAMAQISKHCDKIMMIVDSIPAMLPEGEQADGLSGANMRTNMDLPMFLSRLLRRWIGMAQAYNTMVVLINQLRQKPIGFGDPDYTPGGNAVRFYCHVRVRMYRSKGGVIKRKGKTVGMQGIIRNVKNKSGSAERAKVGFKLYFQGPMEFLPAAELEKDEEK
jgi:recombination protein RecA